MRFAQVSAPVMAKGVEDTAFYRYHPLVSPQRGRRQPGDLRPAGRRLPRRHGDGPAGRRCSPSRRTTPSAAVTCGPGSACWPSPAGVHEAVQRWARATRGTDAAGGRIATPSTCCTRPWSARGRSRPAGSAPSWPRRRGRRRCTRPGSIRAPSTTTRSPPSWTRSSPTTASSPILSRSWPSISSCSAAGSARWRRLALLLDLPGRARPVPGDRAVGPVAGRPGQPPAGRLRGPAAAAGRAEPGLSRPSTGWPTAARSSGSSTGCSRTGGSIATRSGRTTSHCPSAAAKAEHVVAFARVGRADAIAVVVPRLVARLAGTGPRLR